MSQQTLARFREQPQPGAANEPKGSVYIIQDNPQHAFWPAEKFGKLKHCLPSRGDFNISTMVPRLRESLRNFDPATDYVLLSGAPLACGIAFALLHERHDLFRILRWSVPAQDYTSATVDLMLSDSQLIEEKA